MKNCSKILDILHECDKNPYKDVVCFKKRKGRLPNVIKENRKKYLDWEKQNNKIDKFGFMAMLLK